MLLTKGKILLVSILFLSFHSVVFCQNLIEGEIYSLQNTKKTLIESANVICIFKGKRYNSATNTNGRFSIRVESQINENFILYVDAPNYLPEQVLSNQGYNSIRINSISDFYNKIQESKSFENVPMITFRGKVIDQFQKGIDGAIIKLIGTPYWCISEPDGSFTLKTRLDEFLLLANNPLKFSIQHENFELAFKKITTPDLNKNRNITNINFVLKRLIPLDEAKKLLQVEVNRIDSISKLIYNTFPTDSIFDVINNQKFEIDSLLELISNENDKILWLSKRIGYEKDTVNNKFDSLEYRLGKEARINNDKILQLSDSLFKLQEKHEEILKTKTDTSTSNRNYILIEKNSSDISKNKMHTDSIISEIKDYIGIIGKDKILTKRFSITYSTINFIDERSRIRPDIYHSKFAMYSYWGRQKNFSISLEYTNSQNSETGYLNYKFSPFFDKNFYGFVGAGINLQNFKQPKIALQLPLVYDFNIQKFITLSPSIQYSTIIYKENDTNTLESYPMVNFSIFVTLHLPEQELRWIENIKKKRQKKLSSPPS